MVEPASSPVRRRGWLVAAAVATLLLGLIALDRLSREIRLADVAVALRMLSSDHLALALACTAGSYVALTFYDVLALAVIGRRLPWRIAALASFTSYTLSHNLGLSLLSGGSARYRIYTTAGLDAPDIARIIGLAGATFWIGVVTIAGIAMAAHPGSLVLPGLSLGATTIHLAGYGILVAAVAALVATFFVQGPLQLFGFAIPLPGPGQFLAQVAISGIDLAFASTALFVLIPGADPALLPAFALAYALGIIASVVTHIPGGIGVFEAVVLSVLPGDRATLLAALLAYRAIYYLLPLACGLLLLAFHEARRQRVTAKVLSSLHAVLAGLAPLVSAGATFAGGMVLLLSGSLPSIHDRMGDLGSIVPLPFIEASHVAASLIGTALLLLAPGLYRRLDGANLLARVLLLAGALFSLAKGVDYEEAIVCLAIALLLHITRRAFYRRTALLQTPLSAGWMTGVAAVFGLTLWAGFSAFRHVPYTDDLWWRFAIQGDAPRFLRASLATGVLLAMVAVWRLMAPVASSHRPVQSNEEQAIAAAMHHAERTDALLVLTGDKRLLWSDDGDAFLMYDVSGSTWIVMGDPVGPRAAWAELLWRLREMADHAQGRLLLYEVSLPVLDLAVSMGLQIVRFGEEAVVDLPDFTIETPRLRGIRRSARAAARKGLALRIIPAAAVPVILDELQAVSDEWLAAGGHREKRFSLGRFDREYLSKLDVAIVSIGEEIVAFANIWVTPNGSEASVDLMRHRSDAPAGTMDYLFVELMHWAKARGYARFSLGMAPLSGIENRRSAPTWARVGSFLYRHGERVYGFRGLRAYKDKYAPRWDARYVAGPRGFGLVFALRDLSRLINGGGARTPSSKSLPKAVARSEAHRGVRRGRSIGQAGLNLLAAN